jgi:hypothetical protein
MTTANMPEYRMGQIAGGNGKIHDAENVTIWVKTWAQVQLQADHNTLHCSQKRALE